MPTCSAHELDDHVHLFPGVISPRLLPPATCLSSKCKPSIQLLGAPQSVKRGYGVRARQEEDSQVRQLLASCPTLLPTPATSFSQSGVAFLLCFGQVRFVGRAHIENNWFKKKRS